MSKIWTSSEWEQYNLMMSLIVVKRIYASFFAGEYKGMNCIPDASAVCVVQTTLMKSTMMTRRRRKTAVVAAEGRHVERMCCWNPFTAGQRDIAIFAVVSTDTTSDFRLTIIQ